MKYRENPIFKAPTDKDIRIRRYISLPSLLHTLRTGRLWFSVMAHLDDAFEGILPPKNTTEWAPELVEGYNRMRNEIAVNCWHIDPHESAAMWKIYGREHGVAIESTYARLIEAFRASEATAPAHLDGAVFVGMVQYIDPTTEGIPTGPENTAPNAYTVSVYKRHHYAYEKELRAAYSPTGIMRQAFVEGALSGLDVPVDLDHLIERLVLAPNTPDWYFLAVRACVPQRFDVLFSRLDDDRSGNPRERPESGWIKFGKS